MFASHRGSGKNFPLITSQAFSATAVTENSSKGIDSAASEKPISPSRMSVYSVGLNCLISYICQLCSQGASAHHLPHFIGNCSNGMQSTKLISELNLNHFRDCSLVAEITIQLLRVNSARL